MQSNSTGARLAGVLTVIILAAGSVALTAGTASASNSKVSCPKVEKSAGDIVFPGPGPGVDWSGCNLSDADLSWSNLSKANLSKANLTGANLAGTSLSKANLSALISRTPISPALHCPAPT